MFNWIIGVRNILYIAIGAAVVWTYFSYSLLQKENEILKTNIKTLEANIETQKKECAAKVKREIFRAKAQTSKKKIESKIKRDTKDEKAKNINNPSRYYID